VTWKIVLDSRGMEAMLKSPRVGVAISSLAGEVAAIAESSPTARRNSPEIVVENYETDRAASAVVVKHPGGLGMEAKHGLLSKSARAAGLTVKKRRRDS
jgi:hypothetical protein